MAQIRSSTAFASSTLGASRRRRKSCAKWGSSAKAAPAGPAAAEAATASASADRRMERAMEAMNGIMDQG